MELKITNAEEFRSLLTALLDDLVDARFHFSLHQSLVKSIEEYGKEFEQSPTFWGLTFGAHIDAVMLRLCRAYDNYPQCALNLRNLLDTVKANLSIFDEPNFRQRLRGNNFVEALAAELEPPSLAQLQNDVEAASDSDPLVKKLTIWRNNYVAHRNSRFALKPEELAAQYPLSFVEIDVLLTRALEIGNRYSLLFDASAHATLMVGRDDYLNVLKAIREHVEAHKRKVDEEWKRLAAALKPESQ